MRGSTVLGAILFLSLSGVALAAQMEIGVPGTSLVTRPLGGGGG